MGGAERDGDAWLAAVDAAADRMQNARVVMDVTVTDRHGAQARRTLEILQKGPKQRLARITSPARLAGVAVLASADGGVHLYLPAYGRVRRVVGQRRGDAFVGTDFTLEDVTRTRFATDYRAAVAGRPPSESLTRLKLTPRDSAAHKHAVVMMWVGAGDLVQRLEYLDATGKVIRRVSLSDFRVVDGRRIAHAIDVEDVARARRTSARVTALNLSAGLTDAQFTVSRLQHR